MRAKATAISFAMFLVLVSSASAAAAAPPIGQWHRLNPGAQDEHERLSASK